MAEVYLGVALGEAGFRKPVVIKRVLPELAGDERVRTMFADEARLAQHLSHQNVVQVYHAGRSAQGLFLAMEFVNGWNLETVLDAATRARRPFPPALAAYVVAQVHAGLAHAYRRTHEGKPVVIAHRDVSPSNVLLSAEGEVKLSDFGIARGGHLQSLTEPGTFKGKLAYAAPESLRGEAVSAAADQFGLGVVLHELITLRHPFWDGSSIAAYVGRVERGFEPLAGAPVPAELVPLLTRMLSPRPEERLATAELGAALAGAIAGQRPPVTGDALVEFLRGLPLPPPPLPVDRAMEALPPTPEPGVPSLDELGGDPPSGLAPPSEGMQSPQGPGSDWLRHRPALGEDGRMIAATPASGAALPATIVRTPAAEAAAEPAPKPHAVAVAHAASSPVSAVGIPREFELAATDEVLELEDRPRPESDGAQVGETVPRKPLRWGLWLSALLAVGAAGAAVVYRAPLEQKTRALVGQSSPSQAVLLVTSDPSGAKVVVDGQPVGETPLAIANRWGGQVELRIERAGFRTYRTRLEGGKQTEIFARLKR